MATDFKTTTRDASKLPVPPNATPALAGFVGNMLGQYPLGAHP